MDEKAIRFYLPRGVKIGRILNFLQKKLARFYDWRIVTYIGSAQGASETKTQKEYKMKSFTKRITATVLMAALCGSINLAQAGTVDHDAARASHSNAGSSHEGKAAVASKKLNSLRDAQMQAGIAAKAAIDAESSAQSAVSQALMSGADVTQARASLTAATAAKESAIQNYNDIGAKADAAAQKSADMNAKVQAAATTPAGQEMGTAPAVQAPAVQAPATTAPATTTPAVQAPVSVMNVPQVDILAPANVQSPAHQQGSHAHDHDHSHSTDGATHNGGMCGGSRGSSSQNAPSRL